MRLDPHQLPTRDEIKPDVCIYPKRGLSRPFDILKMPEAPLLAIEILSPRQGAQEILEKFVVYFALGVHTCWLVDPTTAVIAVYPTLDQPVSFSAGDVVDETLDIRLPLAEIFE
jgi:Uma2 family endonuclease